MVVIQDHIANLQIKAFKLDLQSRYLVQFHRYLYLFLDKFLYLIQTSFCVTYHEYLLKAIFTYLDNFEIEKQLRKEYIKLLELSQTNGLLRTIISTFDFFFFFKSTIYYMGCNGSPCLQKELCMEYQYPNLFYTIT